MLKWRCNQLPRFVCSGYMIRMKEFYFSNCQACNLEVIWIIILLFVHYRRNERKSEFWKQTETRLYEKLKPSRPFNQHSNQCKQTNQEVKIIRRSTFTWNLSNIYKRFVCHFKWNISKSRCSIDKKGHNVIYAGLKCCLWHSVRV